MLTRTVPDRINIQITSPVSSLGTTPTDLFISEATDSNSGSLSYVELYNGTGSTINLSNYSLKTANNGNPYSFTLPLSNVNLATGSTYVIALGNDGACPSTPGGDGSLAAHSSGSGSIDFAVNGNDHFGLFNGTTQIDSWGTFGNANWAPLSIGVKGADFRRKNNISPLPNTTYNNNDWDIIDYAGSAICANNDYSNIGVYSLTPATNYQYSIDNGAYTSNTTFAGLTPGDHVVSVLDTTNGCSSNLTIHINSVTSIQAVTTFTYTSPVCANVAPTLTPAPATGFTSGGQYTSNLPGLVIDANTGVVNLVTSTPGTYIVTYQVNDASCLTGSSTQFTLVINPVPTATINSPSACAGQPATVIATVIPTTGTYNYVWTNTVSAIDPGNVGTFGATISGNYSVIATDAVTGCASASASGTVTINALPTVTVNNPTVCAGQLATVTATPTSTTTGTYTYIWTVPAGATNPGNVATFNATNSGNYGVTITDSISGCTSLSATSTVLINPIPTVTVTGDTVCQGSQATITANPLPTGTYNYVWTGPTNPGNVPSFTTSTAGTYSVVITDTVSGCTSLSASGTAAFFSSFDFTINGECIDNNFTLEVIPTGNTFDLNTSHFDWQYNGASTGYTDATFNVTNFVHTTTITPTPHLPLTISVNVKTADNCSQNHDITLDRIYCDIQKGISPSNPDGKNDSFDLRLMNVQQLSIFNRYGTKVYTKGDYTNEWIGQSDSGSDLPDGTYYYVIEFKNNQPTKTGWIYINRENK